MLLRSASTPILNSWISHSKDPSPEPEIVHRNQRPRPIKLSSSSSPSSSLSLPPNDIRPKDNSSIKKMTRALSEADLRELSVAPKKKPFNKILNGLSLEEKEEEEDQDEMGLLLDRGLFMGTGLEKGCEVGRVREKELVNLLVEGGCGGSGGKICGGGGGSAGGDDGNSEYGDSYHGNESTDVFYQKMIDANPGNGLFLSNYARFLKEVRGDIGKAEEYCERAILANPNDGNVLSMYGDLVWQSHKDASRAETYFDQAVKAAPEDCYVMASYARFLWDAEEDEEEEAANTNKISQPSFFQGAPVAAAS